MGKVNSFTYGNNVKTSYSYYDETSGFDLSSGVSNSFRLKSMQIGNKNGRNLAYSQYQYTKKDNVAKKEFNNSYGDHYLELYRYDSFDRLTMAESSSNNGIEIYGTKTYTYDILNNILSKDGNTYTYNYWTETSPNAVQSVTGSAGSYDYQYDANGNIITKLPGSVVTRTIDFDTENIISSMSDGAVVTKIKYYFANGLQVAQYSETKGLHYYNEDHLRMHSLITDPTTILLMEHLKLEIKLHLPQFR